MDITLRKKLIDEVLDVDKNIKKRLMKIQIRNLPKEDTAALYTAFDPEELQKLSVFVSSLRKSLENKAHVARLVATEWQKNKPFERNLVVLCAVEEILIMYNYLVSLYRRPGSSQQTRLAMKSILMSLQENLEKIIQNMSAASTKIVGTHYQASYMQALGAYKLVLADLKKGELR